MPNKISASQIAHVSNNPQTLPILILGGGFTGLFTAQR